MNKDFFFLRIRGVIGFGDLVVFKFILFIWVLVFSIFIFRKMVYLLGFLIDFIKILKFFLFVFRFAMMFLIF